MRITATHARAALHYVAAACAAVALLVLVAGVAGARYNATPSLPEGIYWKVNAPLERGAYVRFCPPDIALIAEAKKRGYIDAGYCPGDYMPLMKRVAALRGDVVEFRADGVAVNGRLLARSAPRQADPSGRPLPQLRGTVVVGPTQALMMSSYNAGSFDSRYFGLVERSQVKDVVRPLLTWP
jgi:conjugative transfer signal peptidase TraF